jgi:hypothetical protein
LGRKKGKKEKKTPLVLTRTKGFFVKKQGPNLPDFQKERKRKRKNARFLQQVSAVSQNITKCLHFSTSL